MKTIITLILSLFFLTASAQQNKITEIARLIISDARIDKADVTESFLNGKAYLLFYKQKGSDDVYLASIWPAKNTESHGRIYNVDRTYEEATPSSFKNETLTFKWSYSNSYDDNTGTATIKLGLIYKPTGVTYLFTMLTESLTSNVYKGYVSGTLNLK